MFGQRLAEGNSRGFEEAIALVAAWHLDARLQPFLNDIRIEARIALQADAPSACAVQLENAPAPCVLMETVDILSNNCEKLPRRFEGREREMAGIRFRT